MGFDNCGDLVWLQVFEDAGHRMKTFAWQFLVAILAGLISAWLYDRYANQIRQRWLEVN